MRHSSLNQLRTEHKTCALLFRVANFFMQSLNLGSCELLPSRKIRKFISVIVTSILFLNVSQAIALECNGQYVVPITFSNWGVAPAIGGDFQLNPNSTGTYGSYKWLQWSAASTEEQKQADFLESLPFPGNLTKYQNPKNPTDTSLNPFDWVRVKSGVTIDDELKLAVSSLVSKRVVIPYKVVSETVNGEEISQIGGFREVEFLDFRFNDYTKRMYLRYWGEVNCDTPPNVAPMANSGNYLVVNEQTSVMLDGSNSTDLDGSITAYSWVQISGTAVALQNSTLPTPTFTAPAVTSMQTVVFKLTVTDNKGATSTDAVVVTVNPVNSPPNVNQGVTLECNGQNVIPITFKNWSVAPAIGGDFQLNPNWTGTYGKYYWLQWSAASTEEQKRTDFIESLPYPGTLAKYQNPNNATDTNLNPFDWVRVKSDVPLEGDLRVAVSSLVGKRVVIPYKIVSQTVNGEEISQIGGFREVEFLDFRFNHWSKRMYLRYWGEVNCDTTPNVAPVADAGIDLSVNAQTTVNLNGANSIDSDGSITAYDWIQLSGTEVTLQNSTSPTPTFTAPAVTSTQTLVFQLTVTDNKGATSTDTVVVTVNPATNTPPNANAGTDQTVNEGVNVNLNGSASTDSDGNIASYSWTQTAGTTVTLTGDTTATPSFVAPTLTATAVLTFELTITDNEGATATDTIAVTVNPVNTAPSANAGADQTVNEGVNVNLNGTASTDGDGSIASYSWTQTAGTTVTLTGGATETPSFVAPALTASEVLTFELTITDNEGATAIDAIAVTVNPVNAMPAANAGVDQSVNEGSQVNLDGSASADSDGSIATYHWTQTSGEAVSLLNGSTATPSFTAPTGASIQTLVFELTVTDNEGATAVDSVSITVNPVVIPNVPPLANAGADQTVNEGVNVSLNGTASNDSDGSIVSYGWTQTAGASVTLTDTTTVTPSFVAPTLTASQVLTFELTVIDNEGATAADTVSVTVNPVNAAPTANAGGDLEVDEGNPVNLNGSASTDSDGSIATYQWAQTSGATVSMLNGSTATPSFTAPTVSSIQTLVFALTVTDNEGATAVDSISVSVNPVSVVDTTPPSITLHTSAPQTLAVDVLEIEGVATDLNSTISSVQASSDRYEGQNFGLMLGAEGAFFGEIPLAFGNNSITVKATDSAGNEGTAVLDIQREIPAAPTLVIQNPVNGSVVGSNSISITGLVYSSQPPEKLKITFLGREYYPDAAIQPGVYTFAFSNVALTSGTNYLSVRVSTPIGSVEKTTAVLYREASDLEEVEPPEINLFSPGLNTVVSTNELVISGTVSSQVGISELRLDGASLPLTGADSTFLSFSRAIDISLRPEGEMTFNLVATTHQGDSVSRTIVLQKDTLPPVINIDSAFSLAPAVNAVNELPLPFSGAVSDVTLTGFTINGRTVALMPGVSSGQYVFDTLLQLNDATTNPITVEAWDKAGNRSVQELLLSVDLPVAIEIIAPLAGDSINTAATTLELPVTVRLTGFSSDYQAYLRVNDGTNQLVTPENGLINQTLTLSAVTADHKLYVEIFDVTEATPTLVARSSTGFSVSNYADIPLSVERTEPANNQEGIEPNSPINLYFNRPINPALLSVSVKETVHGLVYPNQERDGNSAAIKKLPTLVEVNKNRETVVGELSFLPDNKTISFYPKFNMGYDGTVFVDVNYEGNSISRFSFKVRPLPTLARGVVVDPLGQNIANVKARLIEISRDSQTDMTGAFQFGFGDSADQAIPGGLYTLHLNPDYANPKYGQILRKVRIEEGRFSDLPTLFLPILDNGQPFRQIVSGSATNMLAGGELNLDLSEATLNFSIGADTGRDRGNVHVSFSPVSQIATSFHPVALAPWVYAMQPQGIEVTGDISLSMAIPELNGSRDYSPPDDTLVLIIAFDQETQSVTPAGVGRIDHGRVVSTGPQTISSLDYLGYVMLDATGQEVLSDYLDGKIGYQQMVAELRRVSESAGTAQ